MPVTCAFVRTVERSDTARMSRLAAYLVLRADGDGQLVAQWPGGKVHCCSRIGRSLGVVMSRRSMTSVRVEDAGDGWPIELATLAVSALFDTTALTRPWALAGGEGSLAHQSPAPPHGRQSVLALKDGIAAIAAASRSVL